MIPAIGRMLVPALAAAGLLAGCSGPVEKAALPGRAAGAANIGVRVIQPRTELASDLTRATGRLLARNEATLSARASGSIAAILADVGDEVKKGQVLLRLDATSASIGVEQARAAVAMAEAGLAVATQDLDRARSLRASGGVAPAGLEKAEAGFKQASAQLKQAEAALRNAQKMLADHTLRAPFDGTITARGVNLGEYVAMMPPTAVFGLVDASTLEVVLPVPETVISTIRPGAIVRGIVNPTGKPFEAKVRVIGTIVDSGARTVEVRADLVGAQDAAMRPNAMVEVDFSNGGSAEGLYLPAQSIRQDGEKRFVWLVSEGKVSRHEIQAEAVSPGIVRVLGGIDGAAQVVADAGSSLQDGMAVRVVQ